MRRREFIALAGASVAWPFAAMAQQAGRMYRVGVISAGCERSLDLVIYDELGRRGFIEGKNFTIECYGFGGNVELSSKYARDVVKARVDVVLAFGDAAIRAAQEATKTIPILAMTEDMLASGFVHSMARPNGNTTGVSILATELNGKRQEILIEAVPRIRQMAALADANMSTEAKLEALQEATRARNIELSVYRVVGGAEIAAAIDTAQASGAKALNVFASPMLHVNRKLIMDRVAALRLPAMFEWPEDAEEGGFAGYGPRIVQVFRELLAPKLIALLRGSKVADIPVDPVST
jgi:putative ABC transport system substrate-binding protein